MLILLAAHAFAADVATGALTATIDGDTLTSLVSHRTGASWVTDPTPIATVTDPSITSTVSASSLPDGQLALSLTLVNPTAGTRRVDVRFPDLAGVGADTPASLSYVFPALGPIFDDEATTHLRYYGGLFPLQFEVVAEGDAGVLWMMTRDPTGRAKTFGLAKTPDDHAALYVDWPTIEVPAGGSVTLEASVGVGADWHDALDAYTRWTRAWRAPAVPRNEAFRQAFHLRQIHLHDNVVLGPHPGAFDPTTGVIDIESLLDEDRAAFGGVDWVHVFDWGQDDVNGRVGDYTPWGTIGAPDALKAAIDAVRADGTGVDLYVEGVLLDRESITGRTYGDGWQLEEADGTPYLTWGDVWHVCPGTADRRDHLAIWDLRRNELRVGADGYYLDQIGFGYQYPCYAEGHEHAAPSHQIEEELRLVQAARVALSPRQVLFSESLPTDVQSAWQDGAFTEAVTSFRADARAEPVHMARFALPDTKTFELLTQDEPLDDDALAVALTFFNGEGQRLMGYLTDDPWFAPETLELINRTWSILRRYEAFATGDPTPLVPTAHPDVRANRFDTPGASVWTLYNPSAATITGPVLRVPTAPGDTWTDCWSETPLSPVVAGGVATIEVSLAPTSVGCVARTYPTREPTLSASWSLDSDAVDAVSGVAGSLGAGATLGVEAPHARFGTALHLDGAGDVAVGPLDLPSSGGLTVAAWVRPDRAGLMRVLAVDGWTDGGFVFGTTTTDTGHPALVFTAVGYADAVVPVVLPLGAWSHVAVSVDAGGTATFFVDGWPRGEVSMGALPDPSSAGWFLGSNGADGHFAGSLDAVAVWDGPATPAFVRALADVSPPWAGSVVAPDGVVVTEGALELWWPGFHDPETGVAGATLTVGSTVGGDDLLGPTEIGTSGWWSGSAALPDGTVYARVVARDAVGLTTTVDAPVLVDTATPPLLGTWDFAPGDDVYADASSDRPSNVTVTAWIVPTALRGMTIYGSDTGGWRLGLGPDGASLNLEINGQETFDAPFTPPLDVATHVALVIDRWMNVTFYVDGAEIGRAYGRLPASPAAAPLMIGGYERQFAGALFDVRLYDGALDPDEIAAVAAEVPDDAPDTGDTDRPVDTSAGVSPGDGDPKACRCQTGAPAPGWALVIGLVVLRRRNLRHARA
jgi:hypothetical protein